MALKENLSDKENKEEAKIGKGSLRHLARSLALQTLFESDSVQHEAVLVLDRHFAQETFAEETITFARFLVDGVVNNQVKLDEVISTSAPNWPMDQMAKIDKNILRLAIFEILFNNDVPVKAAINEAIELAKSFGSESSSRFVNGVLGTVVAQQPSRDSAKPA